MVASKYGFLAKKLHLWPWILCWIGLGKVCTVQVGALKENSSNVSFHNGIFLINGTQDITDIFALFFICMMDIRREVLY